MSHGAAWILAGGVAFATGTGLGWTWRSTPTSVVQVHTSQRPHAPMSPRPPGDPACAEAVAEGLALVAQLDRDAYGEPEPFPPDLDPAYLPDALKARARAVETHCPELGYKLLQVDCSEFPCVTVWDFTHMTEDLSGEWQSREACSAWASPRHASGHDTLMEVWKDADGEQQRVLLLAETPPGWRTGHPPPMLPAERRTNRFTYRARHIVDGVQAEIGARNITPAEWAEFMVDTLIERGAPEDVLAPWFTELDDARAEEAAWRQ